MTATDRGLQGLIKVKRTAVVNANELLEKYRTLLAENLLLREEKEILKARLGMSDPLQPEPPQDPENHLPLPLAVLESLGKNPPPGITGQPDPAEKIRLFMSLFKGRDDVYAKRWESKNGKVGYVPVCRNGEIGLLPMSSSRIFMTAGTVSS